MIDSFRIVISLHKKYLNEYEVVGLEGDLLSSDVCPARFAAKSLQHAVFNSSVRDRHFANSSQNSLSKS